MFTLTNQPQTIGRVLDQGFKLYLAGLKGALGLAALNLLLVALGMAAMMALVVGTAAPGQPGAPWPMFLGFALIWALSFGFLAAITLHYASVARQQAQPLMQSLKQGFRRIPALFLGLLAYAFILVIVAAVPTLLIAVAAGPAYTWVGAVVWIYAGYLAVRLMFYWYAVVLDDQGPVEALRNSYSLVKGNFWRTSAELLVPYAIAFAFMALAQIPSVLPGVMENPNSVLVIVSNLVGMVVQFAVMPLYFAFGLVIFHDLKLRRRGGDLEERMGEAAPATE